MSIQQEHGRWGEELAVDFLEKAGFKIVEKNWHYKKAEIDIIARENDILVFVEVKTRAYADFGVPEAMVNKRKQRLLIDAGMAYMRSIGHEWEIRFDIVAILGTPGSMMEIKHFKDAFFPGIDYT
jgi:putative endonuclease